jgi:hypothetical protein
MMNMEGSLFRTHTSSLKPVLSDEGDLPVSIEVTDDVAGQEKMLIFSTNAR